MDSNSLLSVNQKTNMTKKARIILDVLKLKCKSSLVSLLFGIEIGIRGDYHADLVWAKPKD